MTPIFASIVSFVTTSTLLFLLAAAWVQSQALFAATAFAGAALGVQLAIAAAAVLAVIFVTFSIYKLYKPSAKKAEDRNNGEEVPEDPLQNPTPEQLEEMLADLIKNLEFDCPIGYAPMKDPVTASDNKTYDRTNLSSTKLIK